MDTQESEPHSAPSIGSEHTGIRFIEDLAGPEDRWLTITDAARVTRTSEAMARRWVASGRLPIKRQPAGINQQTRLVRLSDLSSIRPIIDPLAAISDAVHTVDLPSIPRQQALIMQNHERLQQQVQRGQQAVEGLLQEVQALATHQQQTEADLREQGAIWHEAVQQQLMQARQQQELLDAQLRGQSQALQDTATRLTEQVKQLEHDLLEREATLLEQFTKKQQEGEERFLAFQQQQRQQSQQIRSEFMESLQQHQEDFHTKLTALQETLSNLMQQHEQLEQGMTTQHHALVHKQEYLSAFIRQQGEEVAMSLQQQEAFHKLEVNALQERLEQLERWREQYITQAYEKRLAAQEQSLQAFAALLQEERKARQALSDQLEAQQQEALRRAAEDRSAQIPETGA